MHNHSSGLYTEVCVYVHSCEFVGEHPHLLAPSPSLLANSLPGCKTCVDFMVFWELTG